MPEKRKKRGKSWYSGEAKGTKTQGSTRLGRGSPRPSCGSAATGELQILIGRAPSDSWIRGILDWTRIGSLFLAPPSLQSSPFPKALHPALTSWPWPGWPLIGPWQPCDKGETEPPSPECSPTCGRCGQVVSAVLSRVCRARYWEASPLLPPVLSGWLDRRPQTWCQDTMSHLVLCYHPTSSLIQVCVLNWMLYLRPELKASIDQTVWRQFRASIDCIVWRRFKKREGRGDKEGGKRGRKR